MNEGRILEGKNGAVTTHVWLCCVTWCLCPTGEGESANEEKSP